MASIRQHATSCSATVNCRKKRQTRETSVTHTSQHSTTSRSSSPARQAARTLPTLSASLPLALYFVLVHSVRLVPSVGICSHLVLEPSVWGWMLLFGRRRRRTCHRLGWQTWPSGWTKPLGAAPARASLAGSGWLSASQTRDLRVGIRTARRARVCMCVIGR